MATTINIQPQSNINISGERVIVPLRDPSSHSRTTHEVNKSGLIGIDNRKQFERDEKDLRRNFTQILSLDRSQTENQFFVGDILPRNVQNTPIQDMNEACQLLLVQIFLIELIVRLPASEEAKQDFLDFCRSYYNNNPVYLRKIEHFETHYNESEALRLYTNPSSFIYRIVSTTCASLDIPALFQIRFILRDMYIQLQTLHRAQLNTFLRDDLIVYRGKPLTQVELDRLKNTGELFVTRHFLSTTTDINVANGFSGAGSVCDNKISVLISMHIEHTEMQDKPIASLRQYSQNPDEGEVMVTMGVFFRVDSYEEVHDDSTYSVKIRMIRGEDEKQIEKNLIQYHLLTLTAAKCPFVGMAIFLKSIENGKYVGEYCHSMSNALKSSNPQLAVQISSLSGNQSVLVNATNQLGVAGSTNGNLFTTIFPNAALIFSQPRILLITVLVIAVIMTAAIVIPTAIILSPKNNSMPAFCPHITCTAVSSVQNPSANYQVEHIDFNCSQSLYNLTIIQVVQRTFNETHAQQYQTFWNYSTNMTYIQNPSQIIYTWYSLPGMPIVQASFPHFIEAQFYYTNGSARILSADTWQIWLQSICGDILYLSGTY